MSLTPLELLKPTGNGGKFQVQLDQLKAIIQQKGWLDKKIAVLSIVGEFRNGKSFLSNFFIWFLRKASAGGSAQDWLQQQAQVKNGFPWRGGPERHTTGIIAWPEPFLLRSSSGRPEDDVVCLLLDTQGLHDSRTSQEMNAVLFVMAAFLSSTLIFNVNGQLSGNDWGVLQQFVQFAKDATRLQSSGGANPVADKIFQQMLFLVRDWSDPDLAYGYGGGEQYLREEIEKLGGNEELGNGCNQLLSVCEQIRCFLMPHPGGQVADGSFNGAVNEIAPVFLEHLRVFVPSVLSATAISAKKFNGMPLTCQAWLAMFKDFAQIFSSGKIPIAHTILSSFAEITHNIAFQSALKYYEQQIQTASNSADHQRIKDHSIRLFTEAKKMTTGNQHMSQVFLNKLVSHIQKIYEQDLLTKFERIRIMKEQEETRRRAQQVAYEAEQARIAAERKRLEEEAKAKLVEEARKLEEAKNKPITLCFKHYSKRITIECFPTQTIKQVKAIVAEKLDKPVYELLLLYQGKMLKDNDNYRLIKDYNMEDYPVYVVDRTYGC